MTLGELIAALEQVDQNYVVPLGFAHPHSYRGYYHELAFQPMRNITVSAMLRAARSALGTTYRGWKGGEFPMDEYTPAWLAFTGETGEGIGPVLLAYMLGTVADYNGGGNL